MRSCIERSELEQNNFPFPLSIDAPLVTIQLGSTLVPDDIKEGDDVYFECHVESNPSWKKLLWFHDVSNIFSLFIKKKNQHYPD